MPRTTTSRRRLRRSLSRPRYVPLTETRSPMRRVLEDAAGPDGAIPAYDQQHRTIWKAHRLGYLTEGGGEGWLGQLTDAGRAWLANQDNK